MDLEERFYRVFDGAITCAGLVVCAFVGHRWINRGWTTPWVCTCGSSGRGTWHPGTKPEGEKDYRCCRCQVETDTPAKRDTIEPEHPSHAANRLAYARQEEAKMAATDAESTRTRGGAR